MIVLVVASSRARTVSIRARPLSRKLFARAGDRRAGRSGGEGSRTPVLEAVYTSFYMFIRCLFLRSQTMHRHTADSRASAKFLHPSTRSLRRQASLLSMSRAVAGVQPGTSRSIKPRERDLGDLRLFFLVRILTRPTNHPRHAACASNYESKPVRPLTRGSYGRLLRPSSASPCLARSRVEAFR